MFGACGVVSKVRIVTDRKTGQSRGFAFVTMATTDDASNAVAKLNGSTVEGRQLRVRGGAQRPIDAVHVSDGKAR
jgi:RNA recognition motif-containing protein